MAERVNPFQELYLTEGYLDGGAQKFVTEFSPRIVKHALGLFQPGNVILKGLPGSGKSMLLSLFRPDARLAYHSLGIPFPVPKDFASFVGAGINLNRSRADAFGQRPFHPDPDADKNVAPLFFADFLNCCIVDDILATVETLIINGTEALCREIGISTRITQLRQAETALAKDDCWFGYFRLPSEARDLREGLARRITTYRSFLNRNTAAIPDSIASSKTDIGIPITKAVQHLRDFEVLRPGVEAYVRIDQYEELAWLEETKPYGAVFQQVVHKLLGLRDARVSYRIGTRHFAWATDPRMFGTSAPIENERTHKEIDLDELLQRRENRRTWVFPQLAEDIFCRRVKNVGYEIPSRTKSLLRYVFQRSLTPQKEVSEYVKAASAIDRVIKIDPHWPSPWVRYLRKLAERDILAAVLGSAWARQQDKEHIVSRSRFPAVPPWERKIWWKKERYPQALMQVASRNRQQLQWSGAEEIVGLSGSNVLAFLSLCQHIWDAWIRDVRDEPFDKKVLPIIERSVQTIGIQEASQEWFNKIANSEHGDYRRQRFVRYLGTFYYEKLIGDVAMSNPGHNGFSLRVAELDTDTEVERFLKTLTDYGDLQQMKHTSKTKGEKRWKWYLNPILSPYFNVFHVHTKEPIYATVQMVSTWMTKARSMSADTGVSALRIANLG